jgi:DinB superfamily
MTERMATAVIQRISQMHGWLLKVTSDLPREGLVRRFAPTVPPIGWHLWHIARWTDRLQATSRTDPS